MSRSTLRTVVAAVSLVLLAGGVAAAHHSFAAEFDADKRVTLDAVITKVEWTNPHTYFHVDVTDAGGQVSSSSARS